MGTKTLTYPSCMCANTDQLYNVQRGSCKKVTYYLVYVQSDFSAELFVLFFL